MVSAGLWAGGIIALALESPAGGWKAGAGRALIDRFSRVALVAFAITALSGFIRATEELTGFADLLNTDYGRLLVLKSAGVLAMLAMSALAWRRLAAVPRIEAAVAVAVVGVTALLSAYPLPPARLADAVAISEGPQSSQALPRSGDLTLGDAAGDTLVGLTVRPAKPGDNALWIYVLPVSGELAAASTAVSVRVDGSSETVTRCGSTCRMARATLRGGETLTVGAGDDSVAFHLPQLPAPDGMPDVLAMQGPMHALKTLHIDETLRPATVPFSAAYGLQAPDRLRFDLSTGASTIIVGSTRYSRDRPDGKWSSETVSPVVVPYYIWDAGPIIDPVESLSLTDFQVVNFFELSGGAPVWFQLAIDDQHHVTHASMRAQAHFMEQTFSAFDEPLSVNPPGH